MWSKEHPYMGAIKERHSLCLPGSTKETMHLVLDLKGSGICYNVGDSLGVFPQNEPETVAKTLAALKATGDEIVLDKRSGIPLTLSDFLTRKASVTNFSRKFLNEVLVRSRAVADDPKKITETHEVWDLLTTYPQATFTPQELADLMMPLLPRLYSIASSHKVVGEEVHLTVSHLKYTTNSVERLGVCTHYLCQIAPLNQRVVPIYIQPTHTFFLPPDPRTPIIMIGPGTGVAPFRAFMQEREALGATGKNWLFFGERTRAHEFFYEADWQRWQDRNLLQLDVAFSRDQPEKVYVQDRLKERGAEIVKWLEQGAVIYVCGDMHHMAKDVDAALHEIIHKHTSFDPHEYFKHLKREKRYLRDVY